MPRIDQALAQPLLIAGCEPVPLAASIMSLLGILALNSFAPTVAVTLLPVLIAAIMCLRKIAEFDPKFFRVAWANTNPGIRAALRGTRGPGQSLWDMPTAKRSIPLVRIGRGKLGL